MNDAITAIANLGIDGAFGPSPTLFSWNAASFSGLESGAYCVVTGPRGSGKSCLARYLEAQAGPFAKRIRVNAEYVARAAVSWEGSADVPPNVSSSLYWKEQILSAFALILAQDPAVDRAVRSQLEQYIVVTKADPRSIGGRRIEVALHIGLFMEALANWLGFPLPPSINLSIENKFERDKLNTMQRIEILERLIVMARQKSPGDGRKYFVILDGLDIPAHNDALDKYKTAFDVCYELYSELQASGCVPILFATNKLFDACHFDDRSKLQQRRLTLKWNKAGLRAAFETRLKKVLDIPEGNGENIWNYILNIPTPYNGDTFDFLWNRTRGRPRDIVSLLGYSASLDLADQSAGMPPSLKLAPAHVDRAWPAFMKSLKNTVTDEWRGSLQLANWQISCRWSLLFRVSSAPLKSSGQSLGRPLKPDCLHSVSCILLGFWRCCHRTKSGFAPLRSRK